MGGRCLSLRCDVDVVYYLVMIVLGGVVVVLLICRGGMLGR